MRIGQFSDSFMPIIDGVGRVVYNTALQIGKAGHESYVIAPYGKTGYRGNLGFDVITYAGAPVPTSPQYKLGAPILDPYYHIRINDTQFDILHAHSPFAAGQEALRLAKQRNVPLVATFHSKYYDDFYSVTQSEVLSSLGVRFVVDFFERCDYVWTVSNSSADTLRSYGYKGEITVVENGTDADSSAADSAGARELLSLPDVPLLLYVGQIHAKKNLRKVVEASAMLHKRNVEHRLVLCGQGPDRDELEALCASLSISDTTIFTGHISDYAVLLGLYEMASVFMFPSTYDTAGLVVKEAASMGTPSVVVRGSGAAELICDGSNGFLCDNSAESICSAAEAALKDPVATRSVGETAKRTLQRTWADAAGETLGRYALILDEHPYHSDNAPSGSRTDSP
ncbi:MAG: glycosyltransferase [Clostridia bacterium]|nr:glycosyltransferase [Clostridia bacterium]